MADTVTNIKNILTSSEFRLEWIKKEVDILEDKIKFIDELSFKIKGWAIAFWSALMSYALSKHERSVAFIAILVPILFMLVDASYKRYQARFAERTRDIMKFLNDKNDSSKWYDNDGTCSFPIYDLFGIYSRGQIHDPWDQHWGSIFRPLKKASVSLVYWILILMSLVVIVYLTYFMNVAMPRGLLVRYYMV